MKPEENPYAAPQSKATEILEPISGRYISHALSASLLLVGFLGGAFKTSGMPVNHLFEFIPNLIFGTIYSIAAFIVGFIPLRIHIYVYKDYLVMRNIGYLGALTIAFLAVLIPVGLISLFIGSQTSSFFRNLQFCYAHAAPTAILGHYICSKKHRGVA